jgi:hypothetical protein
MSYEWGDGLGVSAFNLSRPAVQQQQAAAPVLNLAISKLAPVSKTVAPVVSTSSRTTAPRPGGAPAPSSDDMVPVPEADQMGFRRWYANIRKARLQLITQTSRSNLEAYYAVQNRLKWLASAQGVLTVADPCVGVAMYMWWYKADKDGIAAWHKDVVPAAGDVTSNASCLGSTQGQLTKAPTAMYNHFKGFYAMLLSTGNTKQQAVDLLANDPGITDSQRKAMLGYTIVEQKAAAGKAVSQPEKGLDKLLSDAKSLVNSFVEPSAPPPPPTAGKGTLVKPGLRINIGLPGFEKPARTGITSEEALVADVTDSVEHDAQVAVLEAQLDQLKMQLEAAAQQNEGGLVDQLQAQIAEMTAQLAVQQQYGPPTSDQILVDDAGTGFFQRYKWLLLGGGALAAIGAWYYMKRGKRTHSLPAPTATSLGGLKANPRKGRKYQKRLGPPQEGMVWRKGFVRYSCGTQRVPGQWVRPGGKKKLALPPPAPTWGAWEQLSQNPRKGRKYQKRLGPPQEGMVWRKGFVRYSCGTQRVPGQWVRPGGKKKLALPPPAPAWGAWEQLQPNFG